MIEGVIALGSNIDPEENISLALDKIAERFQLQKKSKFVYTKPLGYIDQPDFLNGSVLIRTPAREEVLIASLKVIEHEMGRRRSGLKNGPEK